MKDTAPALSLPEQKKKLRIDNIVRNSKHLFEKQGYYNTSISSLCKDAMISSSTFFNYFGSKEKLIELIIQDDIKDFREHVDNLLADKNIEPVECVEQAFNYILLGSIKYKNVVSTFYTLAINDPYYKPLVTQYFEIEKDIVEYAKTRGLINKDYPTDLITRMFHGCYTDILLRYSGEDQIEKFRSDIESLIEILRPQQQVR